MTGKLPCHLSSGYAWRLRHCGLGTEFYIYGLYIFGRYSYSRYSYGVYGCDLSSYGPCSYDLYSYGP